MSSRNCRTFFVADTLTLADRRLLVLEANPGVGQGTRRPSRPDITVVSRQFCARGTFDIFANVWRKTDG